MNTTGFSARSALVSALTAASLFVVQLLPLGALPVSTVDVEASALHVRHEGSSGYQPSSALRDATGPNTYLTSAALAPWDTRRIVVSTTFNGLYESTDGGESWSRINSTSLAPIYMGNGFFDDIALAAYDGSDRNILWVQRAQSEEVLAIDRTAGRVANLSDSRGETALQAATPAPDHPVAEIDQERLLRMEKAADHVSFFLAPWHASEEALPAHMEFAREHGFTAVVIDFKDDAGRIAYNTSLEEPHQVGAVRRFFDARRLIDSVHDNDLYLIARIVVFKDEQLYRFQDNRFALWDSRLNAPWGIFRDEQVDGNVRSRQVEFWVDPFSEFVWDYNIAIARELQDLGVDEIQFDYIRTPAEGRREDILYRYQEDSPAFDAGNPRFEDPRVQALTAFARRARQEIDIPISIDVFGFNGWYRMSYLGQDIAALARYVDVISPMLYPSHFPRSFRGDLPYLEWAEYLYYEGTARGRRITGDSVVIRPYIQSFLIGGELQFEEPMYTEYLKRQIRGSLDAGAGGFTLWNFSGRYYMVSRGLWFDD